MNDSKFRISLDIHRQVTQAHLAVKKGDTGRKIIVSLSDGGVPYEIADGCYAVFMAKKADGNVLYNDCTISNGKIVYSFTEQTASAAGRMVCEFRLYGSNDKLITSPRIATIVSGTVYEDSEVESSSEFTALSELVTEARELIEEWPEVEDLAAAQDSTRAALDAYLKVPEMAYSVGTMDQTTGAEDDSVTYRIRSDYLALQGRALGIAFPAGVKVRVFYYDENYGYTGHSNVRDESFRLFKEATYVRLSVAYDAAIIKVEDIMELASMVTVYFPAASNNSYHGNVTAYGSFSDCNQEGYYSFTATDVVPVKNAETGELEQKIADAGAIADGGMLVVRLHAGDNEIFQTVRTDNGETWFRKGNETFRRSMQSVYDRLGILNLGALISGAPHPDGHVVASTETICTAAPIKLGKGVCFDVLLEDGWVYSAMEYADNTFSNGERTVRMSTAGSYTTTHPYVWLRFNKIDNTSASGYAKITSKDFDWSVVFRENVNNSDVPENIGVLNAILNAKQCCEVKYTPIADLPKINSNGGCFDANKEERGLPYSSTRMEQLFVPNNVSFYTFMSALRNPKSLLYTVRLDDHLSNAAAYYGTVCTAFVMYSLGIKGGYTTDTWDAIPGMDLVVNQSAYGVKLGDVLYNGGHTLLITGIKRDGRGKIAQIEIMDANTGIGKMRTQHRTVDEFCNWYLNNDTPYRIYRYRYIHNTKHTPNAIVPVEDEAIDPKSVVYNTNLMGRLGDKFNVRVGEDVVLDVLDRASYAQYEVVQNGTVRTTNEIPEDGIITLSGLAYGNYSVYLTDGESNSRSVDFIVVDVSIGVEESDGGKYVAFHSANATPLYLGWVTSGVNVARIDMLTIDEIDKGKRPFTNLPTNKGKTASHVWIACETEYGIIISERTATQEGGAL